MKFSIHIRDFYEEEGAVGHLTLFRQKETGKRIIGVEVKDVGILAVELEDYFKP